jgi:membrane protein YdbS with pleckstrin-like domain
MEENPYRSPSQTPWSPRRTINWINILAVVVSSCAVVAWLFGYPPGLVLFAFAIIGVIVHIANILVGKLVSLLRKALLKNSSADDRREAG